MDATLFELIRGTLSAFDFSPARTVMALAAACAVCRAGLNLIDRHQFGHQKLSITELNLYNNAVPACALATVLVAAGLGGPLLARSLDWRCAAFGALIQAVAYGFSHAFRHLTVSQVTVAAKAADLFIPFCVFATTRQWDWGNYAFAVVTTLVYLPILLQRSPAGRRASLTICLGLCALLLVQSAASPWLNSAGSEADWTSTLLFSTAAILWRTLWSLLPLLRASAVPRQPPWTLLRSPLFGLRSVLTVATQLSFILAVSSAHSTVAWPILNSAGLLAMVLSALVLRETTHRYQTAIVAAVVALSLARFVTL